MIRRVLLVSAVAPGVLLGASGCRHKCCRSDLPTVPPGSVLGPPVGGRLPPTNVPLTPPGGGLPPPADVSLPPMGGSGGREPLFGDPLPGGSSSRSGTPVPGILGGPVVPAAATAPAEPAPPAGLPGFTKVKDGVAAGGKPTLDGFDALKQQGYRSVVYLHAAGADLAAVRDVAEKRGLRFTPVEATPETFAAAVDAFNKALADASGRPLYVAADAPFRAGAVWYAHLRTVDRQSDEVARIRARGLGLTDDGDEAKAFTLAVQQYLASR